MLGLKDHKAWYNIVIVLLYNLMDTVGKQAGAVFSVPTKGVALTSLARAVFIPTSIMIMRHDGTPSEVADWLKLLNISLFAFSNGYVCTQCSIHAPAMVKEEQKMQIGMFVSIFLVLGIVCGSLTAIGVG